MLRSLLAALILLAAPAASAQITLVSPDPAPNGVFDTTVSSMLGRRVARLHDGPLTAAVHTLPLDVLHLPAGVYIARASGPDGTVQRRFTVAR